MSRTAAAPGPQLYRFSWPIYAALVSLVFLVNYPGRLSPDTLDMITQGEYPTTLNDWHAPILTWLYSIFAPGLGQPSGALLLQALLLFVYPAIIPVRADNRRSTVARTGLAVASGIFVIALVALCGQILKDMIVIGAVLCLLGVLDLSRNSSWDGKWLAPKVALCFLILAVRPTNFLMLAAAGTIGAFFAFGIGRKFALALLAIFAVCAATLPVMRAIDHNVLGARPTTVESSLIIFDAAGVSSDIKQNMFARLDGWPADQLRSPWECYTPKRWDPFKWGECKGYAVLFDALQHRPGNAESDVRWWLGVILRHPVSYLKHRIAFTLELFRPDFDFSIVGWRLPYATNIPQNLDEISGAVHGGKDLGGGTHAIDMTKKIQMWSSRITLTPFSWVAARIFARPTAPIVGFLLCVLMLLWNWRRRGLDRIFDFTAVTASAIGLGNLVMLGTFGVANDGRYTTLTVVCGIVSLLRTVGAALPDRTSPARS